MNQRINKLNQTKKTVYMSASSVVCLLSNGQNQLKVKTWFNRTAVENFFGILGNVCVVMV